MFGSCALVSGIYLPILTKHVYQDSIYTLLFSSFKKEKTTLKLELLHIHHFVAGNGALNLWETPTPVWGLMPKCLTSPGWGTEARGWNDLEKTTLGVDNRARTNSHPALCSVLCLLNEQSCFLSTHKPNCLSNCSHLLWVQICTAWHELGCKLCRKQPSHPSVMSESSSTMWPGSIWERRSVLGLIPSLCSMMNIHPAAFGPVWKG